ncbi:MAG: alanine racemase, partial [Microlunatus sp.]|nr:alanine racemase [Microlunatus sp.]
MSGVSLRLDVDAWRRHLRVVSESTPGIVPVAKGNGYGFGLPRLALEAQNLGADTIAVGLPAEVALVRDGFAGDIVIMMPWRPDDDLARELLADPRVISTVSRVEDLAAITTLTENAASKPRVIMEVRTSMQRHGVRPDDLVTVRGRLDAITFEGWTIHLPLLDRGRYLEAERLARAALATVAAPLWISHLPAADATTLAKQLGGAGREPVPMRLRVGTRLWLGDPGSVSTG